MTNKQIRILINAAIDASPSLDDDEEDSGIGHTSSGQSREKSKELNEADRRRHRHFLRKRNIKPNAKLAERQRNSKQHRKPLVSKGRPVNKSKGNSIDSIGQLMQGASNSPDIKMTAKARRLLELGGY